MNDPHGNTSTCSHCVWTDDDGRYVTFFCIVCREVFCTVPKIKQQQQTHARGEASETCDRTD